MLNSRSLYDLAPPLQQRFTAFNRACFTAGIEILVTSTFRDNESQAELYAQGRTKPGRIVTNAKAGESFHNYRCAFDVVPMRFGKPVWGTKLPEDAKLWARIGELGEAAGLEWAGRWTKFREMAHFQYTGGLTLADLKAGKAIPA